MPTYAAKTEVDSSRSRDEIERTLSRYGATKFAYGWDGQMAMVQFEMKNRRIRFMLPLPSLQDASRTPQGRVRARREWQSFHDQAVKQRWRALLLTIKAKLESVESHIETFEGAFLAQVVLPDNSTVGDWIQPQVQAAYEHGHMPAMLPAPDRQDVNVVEGEMRPA